jgi:hypothetical protein
LPPPTQGPLEARHLQSRIYRNATQTTRLTSTHWHIAWANGLGWGFDGMDGAILALVALKAGFILRQSGADRAFELDGHMQQLYNWIVFADRPVLAAGHLLTEHLLEEWSASSFAKDPPNATASVLSKDGASVREIPHLEGDKLTFEVRVLDSGLAGADGPVSVFVDIIGLPFTPLSVAGVARRTALRAAWYDAASAPYYYPAYGYPPPPYYPYPYPY